MLGKERINPESLTVLCQPNSQGFVNNYHVGSEHEPAKTVYASFCVTLPADCLAFDRTGQQTAHKVALQREEDHQRQNHRHEGPSR